MKITYNLAITAPAQHLLDISIDVTGIDAPHVDFVLPTWTPGSYLIREYARHVQDVTVNGQGGTPDWRKLDKQTWRVETHGATVLNFNYRVYGNELTVRTNHVDDTHAHIIPAATLMYVMGATEQPLAINVTAPEGWEIATGLEVAGSRSKVAGAGSKVAGERFVADNYDHLVDSPFEIGVHRTLRFTVDDTPHRIVIWGRGNEDEQRLIRDTRKIVTAARDLFGGLPYESYTFFLLLGPKSAGGGLEHRNSTSLLVPRFTFRPAKSYERFLTVAAHEFFHVWNVKRIRAAGLGPFDYTRESYTTLLWAMEGVTEYYTDLLLVRSGLFTPKRYLERLADDIVTLQQTPGRRIQSLECASFDAWITYYRPDENSANTSVSYYLKGALVAALLDLELRRRTGNQRSLDDVLRFLVESYPLDGTGIPDRDGYLAAIRAATGQDLSEFFARYIAGTEELTYERALGAAGLQLTWDWKEPASDDQPRTTIGVRTKTDGGQLKVASVLSDGPAYRAGITADDEIVAVDGFRVVDDGALRDRLNDHRPGDQAQLTLFRREELRTIPVELAPARHDKLTIAPVEQPDEQQRRIYESWLASPGGS